MYVEDEIAILKPRIEILELRSKIAVLENEKHASKINQPLLPEALKQIILQFEDGVGVNHWLKVVDHSSGMYGWDDNTTMLYASSRLAGAAKEWYNGCRSEICTFPLNIARGPSNTLAMFNGVKKMARLASSLMRELWGCELV